MSSGIPWFWYENLAAARSQMAIEWFYLDIEEANLGTHIID
jgi:hypothetical protein